MGDDVGIWVQVKLFTKMFLTPLLVQTITSEMVCWKKFVMVICSFLFLTIYLDDYSSLPPKCIEPVEVLLLKSLTAHPQINMSPKVGGSFS